jgi:transcriptional regulator with XRE-family HTH domain
VRDDVQGSDAVPRWRERRCDIVEIGPRLREARTREGLGVRELAREIGVTAGLISQIETGRTQPSVATLYLLVERLGISLDWLIGIEDRTRPAAGSPVVASEGERPVLEISNGVSWEMLVPGAATGHDLVLVTYEPTGDGRFDDRLVGHGGREGAYLLAGELVLLLDGVRHPVRAGDSLDFDARIPHAYRNEGAVVARGVWFSAGESHRA